MKVTCIADLHGEFPILEGGDLLIVAGDLVARSDSDAYYWFSDWLDAQPYSKKVVIAGNHDNNIDADIINCLRNCSYLCDSGTKFEDLHIWGSPWSLWFHGINPHCKAFTCNEHELKKKYDLIPTSIDILITHSPPYGILDQIQSKWLPNKQDQSVGSTSLRLEMEGRLFPRLMVFGHIHEGYGQYVFKKNFHGAETNILCINASHMDKDYEAVNKPINIEI